jgi:hypothetical protein
MFYCQIIGIGLCTDSGAMVVCADQDGGAFTLMAQPSLATSWW